jgi:TolB-like protein
MSFYEELKRRNVVRVGVAYTVASWLLLQIAEVLAPILDLPIAASKYAFLLLAIGFIPVLIFAWAYEMTPEGLKRESEVEHDAATTHRTAARLDRITIGLVIAAIAIVAVDRLIPEQPEMGSEPFSQQASETPDAKEAEKRGLTPAEANSEPSVAVLPFVNMSSDPEQEFFSDGISEEILNVLTKIPNLKVAARTSSFQFKGQNQDIANIAQQLKVNHILEGSVRKAGNQLRITAQLIEAESGFHLWSDTFDRELKDVFAIQDEIAGAIAVELRARLTDEPLAHSQEVDLQAYELYLRGRGLVASRKADLLFEGIDNLKDALAIEPEFPSAMATLAKAYVVLPYFSDRFPALEMREQARHWANQALDIEPNNTEALSVKAVVLNEIDLDAAGALELLEKAVQSNPGNVAANNFLGDVYFRSGNLDKAIQYESRAAELDPLAPVHLSDLAFVHLLNGDYDLALDLANRVLKQNPAFSQAHVTVRETYWVLGDLQKLEKAIESAITAMGPLSIRTRGMFQLASGDSSSSIETLLADYQLAKTGQLSAFDVAVDAIRLGDFDIAGEMLIKAHAANEGNLSFPLYIRMPEQAPDSEPWQEFWRLPGPARLAEIRRTNGMNPHFPGFGEGAKK